MSLSQIEAGQVVVVHMTRSVGHIEGHFVGRFEACTEVAAVRMELRGSVGTDSGCCFVDIVHPLPQPSDFVSTVQRGQHSASTASEDTVAVVGTVAALGSIAAVAAAVALDTAAPLR